MKTPRSPRGKTRRGQKAILARIAAVKAELNAVKWHGRFIEGDPHASEPPLALYEKFFLPPDPEQNRELYLSLKNELYDLEGELESSDDGARMSGSTDYDYSV